MELALLSLPMDIDYGVVFVDLHFRFFTDFKVLGCDGGSDRHRPPGGLHSSEARLHLRNNTIPEIKWGRTLFILDLSGELTLPLHLHAIRPIMSDIAFWFH
jgi:hypothetical protein